MKMVRHHRIAMTAPCFKDLMEPNVFIPTSLIYQEFKMNKKILLIAVVVVVVAVALVAVMMLGNGKSTTPGPTPGAGDSAAFQAGVFSPQSVPKTMSGFGMLRPMEWSCSAGTLTLSLVNGAGERISELGVNGGSCDNTEVSAGSIAVCTIPNAVGCSGIAKGGRYESTVVITFNSHTGANQIEGKVVGPVD